MQVRDCGNESIEMEVWEDAGTGVVPVAATCSLHPVSTMLYNTALKRVEEYDDDDMMEMGNDSNMSSMSSNTSATRSLGLTPG